MSKIDFSEVVNGGGNGGKTHKPYNRRYNRKRVIALAEQGIPATFIAKDQDVATSTITRYLAKHDMVAQPIKQFNRIKADMLSHSQLQNHTIEDLIKSNWISHPKTILSLPLKEQKDIIHTMQGGRWYDHQSERLERDLSTANVVNIVADLEALREARNDV